MTKARILANLISDNAELADGQISVAEVVGAAPLASPTFSGTVTSSGDVIVNTNGSNASGAIQINNSSTSTYGKAIEAYSSGVSDGKYHQILLGKEGATNNTGTINFKYNSDGSNTNYISFGLWGNDEVVTATGAGNVGISNQAPAYTLDVAGTTSADQYLIDAIAKDIADTAVDVFVYDTRKDSDGGAWRKRTQHTSWYNEAASSTRGSRKEFPAVAVIVATSSGVTIYDGDDPDMPMWMVFDANVSANDLMRSSGIDCITARNGSLIVGLGSGFGLIEANMIADYGFHWTATANAGYYNSYIADRNDASNFTRNLATPIVNNYTNDVAMTVLPNAPIDAATGLPRVTTAVATDGGVSVIKDDGTVVDITVNNAFYTSSHTVEFLGDNSLGLSIGTAAQTSQDSYYIFHTIPTADNVITVDNITGTTQDVDEFYAVQKTNSVVDLHIDGSDQDRTLTAVANDAYGTSYGVSVVDRNKGAADKGMIAYMSADYNTGWMNSDIKLATLSDTDDTNVTGSELVTNGTFDSDTTGWTAYNSTLSIVSGRLRVADNGGYTKAYQGFTTVVGKTYVFSFEVGVIDGSSYWNAAIGNDVPTRLAWGDIPLRINTTGYFSITYTASATTTYIELGSEGTNYVDFDNVSVRLAEEDRSVNGNGLQVFGTVTKTAVASGADLVAYSTGNSASNYLSQPYNADMNVGTGDLCFMSWVKTNTATYNYFFDRRQDQGTAIGFAILVGGNQELTVIARDGNNQSALSGGVFTQNVWTHVCVARRSGMMFIYLDGKLVNSGVRDASIDVSDGTPTHIFNSSGSTNAFGGYMALTRFSATAPSPEQIAKIYEDEKHLFQTGAQATLYGSSDAVTALAYDDSTELLHVGTSAGRSVFQGLRRVDNTTDAVGAAISASNGLVAED